MVVNNPTGGPPPRYPRAWFNGKELYRGPPPAGGIYTAEIPNTVTYVRQCKVFVVEDETKGERDDTCQVDWEMGPIVELPGGGMSYYENEPYGTQYLDQRRKTWQERNATEQQVMIRQAAKKNKLLRAKAMSLMPIARATSPSPEALGDDGFPLDPEEKLPILVCWYSGGFSASEGERLLQPFVDYAQSCGIRDILILHHSNEYGLRGEGYWQWPFYVSKLVDKINDLSPTRPLILFGHSKGVCPALSVATRLGSRVRKVYLTACGSWAPGEETPWEGLSRSFKAQPDGDRALLGWFAMLNPGQMLLEQTVMLPTKSMQETIQGSPFLKNKLDLMRTQYMDAMYPDMQKKVVDTFSADIVAIAIAWDPSADHQCVRGFADYTTGEFNIIDINAGHMDCLSNPMFHKLVLDDMMRLLP